MGDADDDLEIAPSHQALSVVAGWLGMSSEDALEETGAAADELFEKPRPNLLGLGAKFLSHSKAMETASALDHRLKRRIDRSLPDPPAKQQRQLQLGLRGHGGTHALRRGGDRGGREDADTSSSSSDDDDDGGGKLSALTKSSRGGGGDAGASGSGGKGAGGQAAKAGGTAARPLSAEERRRQLLAPPAAELSKWQRKRLRQKEKRANAGQE